MNEFVFAETCDRRVTAPGVQIIGNIDKKLFGNALNEDVDLAVTAEPFARIETHQKRFACFQNTASAQRDFFFQTSAAQGTDR